MSLLRLEIYGVPQDDTTRKSGDLKVARKWMKMGEKSKKLYGTRYTPIFLEILEILVLLDVSQGPPSPAFPHVWRRNKNGFDLQRLLWWHLIIEGSQGSG